MNELKIEHITTSHGDTFEIADSSGNHVTLNPEEALLVFQFLYERAGELSALVNGLAGIQSNPHQLSSGFLDAVTGEPYSNLYATQNPNDPAYWNAEGDTGTAHYNPRIGDDHESIEEHLQDLNEQERRQAEGDY